MFPSLNSIKVIESVHALEKTATPVKQHVRKDWMTTGYHRRIQKKWIKRWGYSSKPAMLTGNGVIFCHPELFDQLRNTEYTKYKEVRVIDRCSVDVSPLFR